MSLGFEETALMTELIDSNSAEVFLSANSISEGDAARALIGVLNHLTIVITRKSKNNIFLDTSH